jgi:hypothetical protein
MSLLQRARTSLFLQLASLKNNSVQNDLSTQSIIPFSFSSKKQMESIEDFYWQKCFGTDWNAESSISAKKNG